jgi:hypothetical protein
LLSGEDEAEFHQLRAQLLDEYDPQTKMGAELVEDLARIMLMKQRAGFYEAAILETRREQLKRAEADKALFPSIAELLASRQEEEEKDDNEERTPEAEWQLQLGETLLHDAANGDVLAKMDRRRAMLTNELIKTLKLLDFVEGKRPRDQEKPLMIEERASNE